MTRARPIRLAVAFLAGMGCLIFAPATTGVTQAWDVAGTLAAVAVFLALFVPAQVDRKVPGWMRTVSALALLIVAAAAFYRWADADWGRLGDYFFNVEVMRREGAMLRMLRGLWIAVQVFGYSLALATVLGLFMAVVRSIVDVFRAVPPIVLLLVTYSALPYSGIVLSARSIGLTAWQAMRLVVLLPMTRIASRLERSRPNT